MNSLPPSASGKLCVISQPTFLPWLGWFDLADQADVMVILDDVAFSRQSWQQRNRIRTARGLEFVTVPVKTAGRLGQRIDETEVADSHLVRKLIGSLRANYGRTPGAASILAELEALVTDAIATGKLVELNCALIGWIASRLEIETPMVRASTLASGGQRGEHVAELCQKLGAAHYLSPAGAEQYLIEDRQFFESRCIGVWIHVYEHPQYTQCFSPFMSFACALDLIFNEGPRAPAIMRSGRRAARPLARSAGPQPHSQSERIA
jgi:hypothetical protein